jgi:hypothetical protein
LKFHTSTAIPAIVKPHSPLSSAMRGLLTAYGSFRAGKSRQKVLHGRK